MADFRHGSNDWHAVVPVRAGLNRLRIEAVDCVGRTLATALDLTPEPLAAVAPGTSWATWGAAPWMASQPGCPFNGTAQDSRAQFVLLAGELAAAGIPGGAKLMDLHLHCTSNPVDPATRMGSTRVRNLRVRMQHTALATSTVLVADGWSTVCAVSSLVPAEGEWQVLPFDPPFLWNGRDHLLVDLTRDDTVNQTNGGDLELQTGLPSRMVAG